MLTQESPPAVSVVVPTYARPRDLARCLDSLARLEYPRACLEVIVVDDGSPAPVAPPLPPDLEVTVIRQAHGGPARARNEGARRARFELVAFTDDDCEPAPDWLRALTRRRSPGEVVGGRTVNATPENPYAAATTLLIDLLFDHHNARRDAAAFLTSSNLLVPAARFNEVGGFDPSFAFPGGEDREFCARWRRRGFPMSYAPDAIVRHSPASRLLPFVRQHFNYGRGASRLSRMSVAETGEPLARQSLSFYRELLSRPFAELPARDAVPVAALLVVCQLATVAGYLRERG